MFYGLVVRKDAFVVTVKKVIPVFLRFFDEETTTHIKAFDEVQGLLTLEQQTDVAIPQDAATALQDIHKEITPAEAFEEFTSFLAARGEKIESSEIAGLEAEYTEFQIKTCALH